MFNKMLFFIALFVDASLRAADDKVLHFGGAAVLDYMGESYLHWQTDMEERDRVLYGAALGVIPGVIKEVADSNEVNNEFSKSELFANIAGAWFANDVNKKVTIPASYRGDGGSVAVITGFNVLA